MPASSPRSSISRRVVASSSSHMAAMSTPGRATVRMWARTWRCTSAAWRTSLTMPNSRRACSRFSSDVSRHRWLREREGGGEGGGEGGREGGA